MAEKPEIGDHVTLRGRDARGVLRKVDKDQWCWVEWERSGPRICHLRELVKMTEL